MFCDVVRIVGSTVPEESESLEDEWGTDAEAFNVCNCFP